MLSITSIICFYLSNNNFAQFVFSSRTKNFDLKQVSLKIRVKGIKNSLKLTYNIRI